MRPPKRRYAFDQIVDPGRWAWASSKGDDQPDLYLDGHRFWHRPESRVSKPAPVEMLPREGRWHARDCLCGLCWPRGR